MVSRKGVRVLIKIPVDYPVFNASLGLSHSTVCSGSVGHVEKKGGYANECLLCSIAQSITRRAAAAAAGVGIGLIQVTWLVEIVKESDL